jgi:hypothetical protein
LGAAPLIIAMNLQTVIPQRLARQQSLPPPADPQTFDLLIVKIVVLDSVLFLE